MQYNNINITWTGHDGFYFVYEDTTLCIDPFKVQNPKFAHILLLTHEHFDHTNIEDLQKIATKDTIILCPPECLNKLSQLNFKSAVPLQIGEEKIIGKITIQALAAYNTNKYRDAESKIVFHPKEDGKLGYLMTLNNTKIYHAGDTDLIPEMNSINCDIALLPVSGTYVMTANEAAQAAQLIKPKLAIPMHYGTIVGTEVDAQNFAHQLQGKIETKILLKS